MTPRVHHHAGLAWMILRSPFFAAFVTTIMEWVTDILPRSEGRPVCWPVIWYRSAAPSRTVSSGTVTRPTVGGWRSWLPIWKFMPWYSYRSFPGCSIGYRTLRCRLCHWLWETTWRKHRTCEFANGMFHWSFSPVVTYSCLLFVYLFIFMSVLFLH